MFDKGMLSRARGLYAHAMDKYQSWGAKAIVRRLGVEMQQKFGSSEDLVGHGLPWCSYSTEICDDPTHREDGSSVTRKRSTYLLK